MAAARAPRLLGSLAATVLARGMQQQRGSCRAHLLVARSLDFQGEQAGAWRAAARTLCGGGGGGDELTKFPVNPPTNNA